ncbi:response regulator transcription factor [Streptomyces sp. NPDC005728]|uniref:response regulator transcription factor n=1 Tax=Streptomyces sp. NPDC005728 TaxID=3157054 RepID=UPI0033D66E40
MTIRVLLADDQRLVRAGFRVLIDSDPELGVVGEAENGEQAVTLARDLTPDLVLMDIRMPVKDGITATAEITSAPDMPGVRIVILTTFGHDEYVFGALRAGASGFLMKDTAAAELLSAIKTVVAGESLLVPRSTLKLIERFAPGRETTGASARVDVLTDREREVLVLVGRGLSNDEIAGKLVLSPQTAKTHVSRILSKLKARDRAQLVILAYESRLLVPGDER